MIITPYRASTKITTIFTFCLSVILYLALNQVAEAKITNVNGVEIEILLDDFAQEANPDEGNERSIDSFIIEQGLTGVDEPTFSSDNYSDDDEENQESIWVRIRDGFEVQDLDGEYVNKYEKWYGSRPDYVERMLTRSQKYLFYIVEEVQKRNMPTEIALLPMIESGYNPQAYSKSHASGIWQFVPSTGKYFGLKQNYWTDKRRDVTAATNAALTYLQKLHGMFGSWDLALASYNAGEGTVMRAIERNKKLGLPTDYENLDLPEETKQYVPKLQAVKNIIYKPHQFGIKLVEIPNRPYFTRVIAPKQIDSKIAANLAEISHEEFNALNPSYNRPVIVSNNEVHQLLLPVWAADNFRNNLKNYDKPLTNWEPYQAKRGESINQIAKNYGISASKLRKVNNLSSGTKVLVSRAILVPSQSNEEPNLLLADFKVVNPTKNIERARTKTIQYKVKRGDTLTKIAQKYKVSNKTLLRTNKLKSSKLKAGQTLTIVHDDNKRKKSTIKMVNTKSKKRAKNIRNVSHKKTSRSKHKSSRM